MGCWGIPLPGRVVVILGHPDGSESGTSLAAGKDRTGRGDDERPLKTGSSAGVRNDDWSVVHRDSSVRRGLDDRCSSAALVRSSGTDGSCATRLFTR
jgi:hypothetical protein